MVRCKLALSIRVKPFVRAVRDEALCKLNSDFSLCLDLKNKPCKAEISEYCKRMNEKKSYQKWEKRAFKILSDWVKMLEDFKERYKAASPENLDERLVLSLTELETARYILEDYCDTAYESRKDEFECFVNSAKERLDKYRFCREGLEKTNNQTFMKGTNNDRQEQNKRALLGGRAREN